MHTRHNTSYVVLSTVVPPVVTTLIILRHDLSRPLLRIIDNHAFGLLLLTSFC
jgi:hypothetical protein